MELCSGLSRRDVRDQKSEVRSQRSEVRSQRSEVRGQRSQVRGQGSGVRGQRSEVRGQRSEIRGQRSEIRGQRSDRKSGGRFMGPQTRQASLSREQKSNLQAGSSLRMMRRRLSSWDRLSLPRSRALPQEFESHQRQLVDCSSPT